MSAHVRWGPPCFGAKLLVWSGTAKLGCPLTKLPPDGFLACKSKKTRRTAGGFPSKRGIGDVLGSTLVSVSLLRCGSSGFDRVPETLLPLQWSPWPYLA